MEMANRKITLAALGVRQARLNRSAEANFVLLMTKSADGPISSNSIWGVLVPLLVINILYIKTWLLQSQKGNEKYRKILVTAEENLAVDSRERKSMLETCKTNLFHYFSTEKVDKQRFAFGILFVLVPDITREDQARLVAIHHFGVANCSQGFELFHTKFNHVEQLVVKHSPWKFRWLLVWAINSNKI
jgi:hypothetical protein